MSLFKSTRSWSAIIAVMLVLSVACAYVVYSKTVSSPIANIYLNGELIKSIALDAVKEGNTFKVDDGVRGYNIIEIEHGKIRMSEANCPDHICTSQGWISDGITPIVCLPHRLVIEITGVDNEIDTAS